MRTVPHRRVHGTFYTPPKGFLRKLPKTEIQIPPEIQEAIDSKARTERLGRKAGWMRKQYQALKARQAAEDRLRGQHGTRNSEAL